MSTLEDYDIGQLLGRGGFANVFRAKNRLSRETVAIKVISKSTIEELNLHERVRNEIRIHSKLQHHHVVQYKTHFETTTHIYIVMESCSHGNLYRYFKKQGRLSEAEAAHIVSQLLQALEYLHSNGIVHRDLKLSNIILNQGLEVKLCDFGLAIQLEHPDEEHFTICGTPNYIAPEIASQKSHGCPADLWSVGCLFYSLVTGIMPFEHPDGVKETLQNIIVGNYEQPRGVSKSALDFLNGFLDLNPNTRANAGNMCKHPFLRHHLCPSSAVTHEYSNEKYCQSPTKNKDVNVNLESTYDSTTPIRPKRIMPLQFESPSSAITEFTDATCVDEYQCPMNKSGESDDVTTRLHHASPMRPQHEAERRNREVCGSLDKRSYDYNKNSDTHSNHLGEDNEDLIRATGSISPVFCEEPDVHRIASGTSRLHSSSHLLYADDDDDLNGKTLYSSHEFRESISLMRSSVDDSRTISHASEQSSIDRNDKKLDQEELGIQQSSYLDSILHLRSGGSQTSRMSIQSSESLSRLTLPSLLLNESNSFISTDSKRSQRLEHVTKDTSSLLKSVSSSSSSSSYSGPSLELQSWVDPNLSSFAHSNKVGDALIVAKSGDIVFCTRLSTRTSSSPLSVSCESTTGADTDYKPFRFCVRKKQPHVLHIGVMDEEMIAEMQLIDDHRCRRRTMVSPLESIERMHIDQNEVNRYNQHLESSDLNEAICFSAETVNAANGIDNCIGNTDTTTLRTIDYDSLKLLRCSSWKKTYNIHAPSVPTSVRIIYTKVGEMLQETKARIPKLVMYLSVRNDDGEVRRDPYIYCKCMLMANGTLPDFRIQWLDRTKLRYSLQTGRIHIKGPNIGSLHWQGGMDDNNLSWLNASDRVKEYLLLSQEMMKRCVSMNNTRPIDTGGHVSVHFEEMSEKELMIVQRGRVGRSIINGEDVHENPFSFLPPPEEKVSEEIAGDYLFPDPVASQFLSNEEDVIFASVTEDDDSEDMMHGRDVSSLRKSSLSLEQQ